MVWSRWYRLRRMVSPSARMCRDYRLDWLPNYRDFACNIDRMKMVLLNGGILTCLGNGKP